MGVVGEPVETGVSGVWSLGVFPGHADVLLGALDPEVRWVVVECGDPSKGWHDALVTIGPEAEPNSRRVRRLAFDVLVNPSEATELGPFLRDEHDGQLHAIQFTREPNCDYSLPAADRGLAQAMAGLGVHLTIDLPHDGEVANIRATRPEVLKAFGARL